MQDDVSAVVGMTS